MRRFMTEDRSHPNPETTRKENLSLIDTLNITDFSEEEADKLADLQPGESMTLTDDDDLYFERTE